MIRYKNIVFIKSYLQFVTSDLFDLNIFFIDELHITFFSQYNITGFRNKRNAYINRFLDLFQALPTNYRLPNNRKTFKRMP